MNPGRTISLNHLAAVHRDEIDRMQQGIRGDADSALWTAELRAATRGGKPCGQAAIDGKDSNNQ
jgi:hypothetical protein